MPPNPPPPQELVQSALDSSYWHAVGPAIASASAVILVRIGLFMLQVRQARALASQKDFDQTIKYGDLQEIESLLKNRFGEIKIDHALSDKKTTENIGKILKKLSDILNNIPKSNTLDKTNHHNEIIENINFEKLAYVDQFPKVFREKIGQKISEIANQAALVFKNKDAWSAMRFAREKIDEEIKVTSKAFQIILQPGVFHDNNLRSKFFSFRDTADAVIKGKAVSDNAVKNALKNIQSLSDELRKI
jgi:hypothetical protein